MNLELKKNRIDHKKRPTSVLNSIRKKKFPIKINLKKRNLISIFVKRAILFNIKVINI